jgi:GNAT superfamily N-acetyltransferase
MDLIVACAQKAERGQKIGVRLMQTIEQHFRDRGCIGCHVDCFAPNVDVHEFYRSLGYDDRLISLLKLL